MTRNTSITPTTEFVAFDTETTGLHPVANKLVEIGAVRFRFDGTELDRFEQLIDPGTRIPPETIEVHGITDEMVAGQPTSEVATELFIDFIGNSETILLAHNAPFDIGFLGAEMHRLDRPLPRHPIIDTLGLARRRLPGLSSYRLESVAEHTKVTVADTHRALGDSLLVKAVFTNFWEGTKTPQSLLDLAPAAEIMHFEDSDVFAIEPPPGFEQLGLAIEARSRVTIIYAGGSSGLAPRVITPSGMMKRGNTAYLAAFCHKDQMDKTFRLDRIQEFTVDS